MIRFPIALIAIQLCLQLATLMGETLHSSADQCAPQLVIRYSLKDLGAAGLSALQLSRLEPLYSLAPSINNRGQILYNTAKGAHFRDPNWGETSFSSNELIIYGHALNNCGDALLSLDRNGSDTEWMVWSLKSTLNSSKPQISKHHIGQLGKESRAFFCAINDNRSVTGYREIDEKLHPLEWNPCSGLRPVGYCDNYDITGFPRGINNMGSIVGYFEDKIDSPPFLWDCCNKLQVLYNYRNMVNCQGWIELADMVISGDNRVFGTYLIKHIPSSGDSGDLNSYYTYLWHPEDQQFMVIGLKDFRIAAINNSNTLVGSLRGRAALRYDGQPAVDLNSLIENGNGDWELLEATAINDLGHIVGYGTFKGEMHLFLLEPTK